MDQRSTVSTELNSTKIKVKGFEINYIKVGNGPQQLLIFPGVLGQISDFRPLTENLDGKKYTIYVWEPPGYGSSRPPGRDLSPGFLYRDAECAIALMEALGINRFSMLGWCNGGCTAMIVASRAADRVDKLVVWGSNAFVTARDLELYETTRDVRGWPDGRRIPQFETYGEEYLSDTWSGWIDAFRKMLDEHDGDVCRGALAKINVPTLVVHGAKDEFVPVEHGVYLHENIERSTTKVERDSEFYSDCVNPFCQCRSCVKTSKSDSTCGCDVLLINYKCGEDLKYFQKASMSYMLCSHKSSFRSWITF